MPKLYIWILVAAICAVPLWWAADLYIRIQSEPKGTVHTTFVLEYSGRLGDSKSVVHLKIYKIEKFSTGLADANSIFQNRIELNEASRHAEFMWPSNTNSAFAGSDAAVQDLNGDGVREIVVYNDDRDARVVTYENGQLRFRTSADALNCHQYDVKPVQLKGNFIFVCGVPFPNGESHTAIFIPRLFRWTPGNGFYDVSRNHADYYRTKLLPDLRARMAAEEDADRKRLYQAAIKQLSNSDY